VSERGRRKIDRHLRPSTVILVATVAIVAWVLPGSFTGESPSVGPTGVAAEGRLLPANPIEHVVVIVLENGGRGSILKNDPYQAYLSKTYGSLPNYYAVCHASNPNYFAITSGYTTGCETGAAQNVGNIPATLVSDGLSWGGYFESMPSPCDRGRTPMYGTDHNPFLSYQDIVRNSSYCDAHVVNSAAFNSSVANGTLPSFSFYVPNLYDDCHTAPPTEPNRHGFCDAWLKGFLSPLLNSTSPAEARLVSHTAFLIAYDEGTKSTTNAGYNLTGVDTPYCRGFLGYNMTACGGSTYVAVVSPYSLGTTYSADATDVDLASTIEWLLGIGSDGGYDQTAGFPALESLFSFPLGTGP
jgi:phospholipase C